MYREYVYIITQILFNITTDTALSELQWTSPNVIMPFLIQRSETICYKINRFNLIKNCFKIIINELKSLQKKNTIFFDKMLFTTQSITTMKPPLLVYDNRRISHKTNLFLKYFKSEHYETKGHL
jgi:hypothetical protein